MKFTKVKTPEFTLSLSVQEAVDLWHIVNKARLEGNKNAEPFINALAEFASRSNSYTQYLEKKKEKRGAVHGGMHERLLQSEEKGYTSVIILNEDGSFNHAFFVEANGLSIGDSFKRFEGEKDEESFNVIEVHSRTRVVARKV